MKKTEKGSRLIVRDNGSVLPEDFDIERNKGFGSTLVRMLTKQLNGRLLYENCPGAGFTIDFPESISS